ncbi:MAG: alpha/beta fold hydrolase [Chloroflexota bacterium]|nr:alpha/beta fold hydrolase [Chloroflexota bacterium]
MSNGGRTITALRAAAGGLGAVTAAVLAAAGGWIVYSAFGVNRRQPLPEALAAPRRRFDSPVAGRLSYYAAREAVGRPLVLIHSVNAAASAYEMRPLFERYRGRRPVYAPDLPGFGHSARTERIYSPALFTAAIADLLQSQVVEREPADVIALSLGAEFAARAALACPDRVRSLTLVSPTGLGARQEDRAARRAGQGEGGNRLPGSLSSPLLGQALYDLLVTPPGIRYFLGQAFEGRVDPGLADYDYLTSHQPGARHAPLYFISGRLFTPSVRETVYECLSLPVLVLYDRDEFVGFDLLPDLLRRRPNWRAERIAPTKGLPHFEQPERTVDVLDRFWGGLDTR